MTLSVKKEKSPKLHKLLTPLSVVAVVFVLAFCTLVSTSKVSAVSRIEACQRLAGGMSERGGEAAVQGCMERLNQETWSACINNPNPGQCATDYKNGEATDSAPGGSASTVDEPTYAPNDCGGQNIQAGQPEGSENHCGILDYLVLFINVLSGLAGIVIVASIIYGGIQYSSAAGDPQKVSAAKERIRNAIIALIFFIFGYAILNYLVPGGVL